MVMSCSVVRVHGLGGRPQRHPRFYFPDGNVVFLVEDVLFNVHRYFFQRDSPVFSAMFSLPKPEADERPEGEDDEKPIVLSNISKKDFERLLVILYPINFHIPEISSIDEWTSVLSLSTQWEINSVRHLAIGRLSKLSISSSDRVALGKRYDVPEWLADGYCELCLRDDPLTLLEGHAIGLEDVIEISNLRTLVRYASNLKRHPDTIRGMVKEKFRIELPMRTV
ncbi:hypothetical protein D9619_001579 [Psilocybe cf. subviscida]|uniref:BTB domain-containing protein n=1 Tax=Psilocybe cf. subviscida TaxID=2480587 RepID=A0A8H5F223_9AGAR|nr:hypothetical protein D9619_001579 [Psilocybe cf. subviscida]